MLILKRPWTRQPQTVVGVDWSNPITSGLVGAWLPKGSTLYDAAGKIGELTASNTATVVTSMGVTTQLPGTSYLTKTPQAWATTLPLTMSIWIQSDIDLLSTASRRVFDLSTGSTADDVIGIQQNYQSGNQLRAQHFDGTTDSAARFVTSTATVLRHVVAVFESVSSRKLYLNGALVASDTTAVNAPSGVNRVTIGYAAWSPGEYFIGNIIAPKIWARALSEAEVRNDYYFPWGVFAPRRIYIPTAAAAASAPTITALSAIGITATSAQPRISYS